MNRSCFALCFIMVTAVASCKQASTTAADTPAEVRTQVAVTHPTRQTMTEFIEVNATSAFQLKNIVKANANGYLRYTTLKIGQFVKAGDLLFTIKTKEAEAIGNAVNALDSSFRFSGTNRITAAKQGYITQIDHQQGDYVQDGEQLAIISDASSFAFLMDLPYELRSYLLTQNAVELHLPDGEQLQGKIASIMPSVDPVSQTERVVIKVNSSNLIPENLVAKVRILKSQKNNAITVPKEAILTDESQSQFWIMKLINDSTAVRFPIQKGLEQNQRVEVKAELSDSDRIVVTGNYGLEDSARVTVTTQQ